MAALVQVGFLDALSWEAAGQAGGPGVTLPGEPPVLGRARRGGKQGVFGVRHRSVPLKLAIEPSVV